MMKFQHIKSIKESTENSIVSWDKLTTNVKQSIQQAREDVKAGRIVTRKKFWDKYEHRL